MCSCPPSACGSSVCDIVGVQNGVGHVVSVQFGSHGKLGVFG